MRADLRTCPGGATSAAAAAANLPGTTGAVLAREPLWPWGCCSASWDRWWLSTLRGIGSRGASNRRLR